MKIYTILRNLIQGIKTAKESSISNVNTALERNQYAVTLESFMSVKSWGSKNVVSVGGIHFISLWGIYSSRSLTSDTKIGNIATGTYKTTTGMLTNGAIIRIDTNGDIYANFINANNDYFGMIIAVEASYEVGGGNT